MRKKMKAKATAWGINDTTVSLTGDLGTPLCLGDYQGLEITEDECEELIANLTEALRVYRENKEED